MKKIKTVTFLFVLSLTSISHAQDKMKEKATEQVKEFNLKLDNETLTSEQETLLVALFAEKQKEIRAVKKEVSSEEDQKKKIKEIQKKYSKKISDEILTDKQRKVLKESSKNQEKNTKE